MRAHTTINQLYLDVMRRINHYRWFSLFMKHVGSRVDRALIRTSRGRLSMSGPQMTTMLLTTKGRRSGKDRTVPLYYVRDGKNLVAACENFGLDAASSWPQTCSPTQRHASRSAAPLKGIFPDLRPRTRSPATCRNFSRCGPPTILTSSEVVPATS